MMNTMSGLEYQHTPLPEGDSIRVCQLEPGNEADDVHVRLLTFDLSTEVPYTALSYVWGHPEDRATVRCHGKRLTIPASLLEALKAIRHPTLDEWLWADSICIDQQNTREKNHQVALMGNIYGQASRVTVWLGADPDDIASGAFSLAKQIALHEHPLLSNIRAVKPPHQELSSSAEWIRMGVHADPQALSDLDSGERRRWEHLAEVSRRPWFTRIWVIQEVGMASSRTSVMCGNRTIPWQQLAEAARQMLFRAHAFLVHFNMAKTIYDCFQIYDTFFSDVDDPFVSVLSRCSHFDCGDPRDKIYALLSHPSARMQDGNTIVQPDYTCSIYQLNVNLATQTLGKLHSLQILSAVQHYRSTDLDDISIASWVPSFEKPRIYNMLWGIPSFHHLQTATKTLPRFHKFHNSTTLKMVGLLVGSIDRCGTTIKGSWFRSWASGDLHHLKALISFIGAGSNSSNCIYPTLADRAKAICTTLTAGEPHARPEHFTAFAKVRIPDTADLGDPNSSSEAGDSEMFAICAAYYTNNRRLFATAQGYIGLGPCAMQEYDILCVLFGCLVPFVLRPSGERYRLVGECYVHGIMQGEAIQVLERGEYMEQEFVLY